jgi:hypothetical protein
MRPAQNLQNQSPSGTAGLRLKLPLGFWRQQTQPAWQYVWKGRSHPSQSTRNSSSSSDAHTRHASSLSSASVARLAIVSFVADLPARLEMGQLTKWRLTH